MLRTENLTIKYYDKVVLDNISLTVNDGEIVGIIGPSGSGKSVLLRSFTLLEMPVFGKVFFNETELTDPETNINSAREKIGMVFQNFNMFEHMNVLENVMSGLIHIKKESPEKAYNKAMELLKLVDMSGKAYCYPDEISGGQKQRAAIARALAMNPEIILMDEPTSSLDPAMRGEVESVIRMLAGEGRTMVIVSHEMDLIRSVCNRVLFIKEGKVLEEGTPEEIFDHPKYDETKRFVRQLRVLEFNISSKDFDFLSLQTMVSDFVFRNGVAPELHMKLGSALEEIYQMIVVRPETENTLHISVEYDRKNTCIKVDADFEAEGFDPEDPDNAIPLSILKMRCRSFEFAGRQIKLSL